MPARTRTRISESRMTCTPSAGGYAAVRGWWREQRVRVRVSVRVHVRMCVRLRVSVSVSACV